MKTKKQRKLCFVGTKVDMVRAQIKYVVHASLSQRNDTY